MAKKMGSNLKLLTMKAPVSSLAGGPEMGTFVYDSTDGMDAIWKQPDEGALLVADKLIVGGTPEKLVERLTGPIYPGRQFTDAFLLTFRTFLAPVRFAELLGLRLRYIPKPIGVSKQEFATDIIASIRLRVFNCLRLWLTDYPRDFDDDAVRKEATDVLEYLASFTGGETMADRLQKLLATRPSPGRPSHPSSVIESAELAARVSSWSALDLARHLAQVDWNFYRVIQSNHLLDTSHSVQTLLKWNATFSSWIEWRVVESGDREGFLQQLDFFINVAHLSLSFNNLSSACIITLALQSLLKRVNSKERDVQKLTVGQKKWLYLTSIVEMDMEGTERFLDRYRAQPAVPWLFPFVSAVAMMQGEESDEICVENSNSNKKSTLVNFKKRLALFQLIELFKQFRGVGLDLEKAFELSDVEPKALTDFVWSCPERKVSEIQERVVQIKQPKKWTKSNKSAPSSPRGAGAVFAGRRKSNVGLDKE
jgi:hypothetical protein